MTITRYKFIHFSQATLTKRSAAQYELHPFVFIVSAWSNGISFRRVGEALHNFGPDGKSVHNRLQQCLLLKTIKLSDTSFAYPSGQQHPNTVCTTLEAVVSPVLPSPVV
ncbi:unnamed protein product [Protopolystoma xenopodis]|uniref:Uncharacterized protein n=1 Tax=Protopolystoma xenopodis TaxID=117903 RepID=A0A3S5AJJ6_9PLAT|nr:unnamed protein product [Protopolystoma xenopodis]